MRREKTLISNELRDSAAAEVVSFILILAAVAAGIGISAAVILPEMEKTAEVTHSTELQDGIFSLKTALDKQWLLGVPGTYGSLLLPSENTALHLKPGAEISFRHTDRNKTANLLHLSALPAYTHLENRGIVLEGGAVFLENRTGSICPVKLKIRKKSPSVDPFQGLRRAFCCYFITLPFAS